MSGLTDWAVGSQTGSAPTSPGEPPTHQRPLRRRIIAALLLVSLLPLCLMGWGAWVVFGRLAERAAIELQRSLVQAHAAAIERFLEQQRNLLRLVATTQPREGLSDPAALWNLFESLNRASQDSFVDLGVIAADGQHLAYVGPHDLTGRNYRESEWFREVMARGVYVSDVFLGFRQVPHLIVAIRQPAGSEPWVLRATINSDKFGKLVRTGVPGASGDAYLVNRDGIYQTTPRVGAILDRAESLPIESHTGFRERVMQVGRVEKIVVTTWLNDNRWLLVVQRDAAEVRAPVAQAVGVLAALTAIAVGLAALFTALAARHLTRQIDRATCQRDELSRALLRSAKLASVGELATGLAHEINNPLAIISAEQTNIADVVGLTDCDEAMRDEVMQGVARIRRQVERCSSITTRMLQFGRQREAQLVPTDLVPRLREIIALLERQASVRNIELTLEAEPGLPHVVVDPVELEQVVVNLINNAFSALQAGGTIAIRARRTAEQVHLEVSDTGEGMPQAVRERAFEPFFTTKPVGRGTGLGLSVCYGIVRSWDGQIELESEPGKGTTVRIRLPLTALAAQEE